jgi:hypothetical protein
MKGYLYVVDRLWCLHSADASVNMFFGDLNFKTIYSPVKSSAWLPISYQFQVSASIMGIKADYKYTSSVKFGHVSLNEKDIVKPEKTKEPELAEPVKPDPKRQKNQEEIENLLSKEDLTNRDMMKLATLMSKEAPGDTSKTKSLEIKSTSAKVAVEKDALKKDTAYWSAVRPIPLTTSEALIPGLSDTTLTVYRDSIGAADTVKTVKKPGKMGKITGIVFNGAGFWAFDSTLHIHYDGLLGLKKVDFNTVDGFVFRQTFSLEQKIDSAHRLKINPGLAYAFSREKLMWWTDISYDYLSMRRGKVLLHMGSESADYNTETGINSTINSLATLFFRRNYMKLYQLKHAFISNSIDIANGLNLSLALGYRTAEPLDNHSDYSFFYRETREFSDNVPNDDPEDLARNTYNKEAYWDMTLEYTPQYYYRVWSGRKYYQHSKYPTFYLRNRMAIPGIQGSAADYDLLEMGIRQRKEWGMMHAFSWNLKGGVFLNNKQVFLMDDKYFNNQDLPLLLGDINNAFHLLPYYRYATTDRYAEAHIRFTTPYLAVKYLPFLSNKLWCENLHLNYLTNDQQQNYWEIGYSISQIYMIGSIGVYVGFKGTSYHNYGIQVSIEFE